MARHRDIRNMVPEDYAYDDEVYGHSVDDDYYISPSHRQFIYNREVSTRSSESDIKEELEVEVELSDTDKAKLESCIDKIKEMLGALAISRNDLVNIIVQDNFDVEKATNTILENPRFSQTGTTKAKDDKQKCKQFIIPKLNLSKNIPQLIESKKKFNIPNIFNKKQGELNPGKFIVPKLNFSSNKLAFAESNTVNERVPNNLKNSFSTSQIGELTTRVGEVKINEPSNEESLKIKNPLISEHRSLSSLQNSSSSKWQIDLSAALKTNKSVPIVPKAETCQKETFEMPYIECDRERFVKKRDILKCTLDVSHFVAIQLDIEKKRSNLGKVLSKKYKRSVIKLKRNSLTSVKDIKKFSFSTPSPDNNIIKHLSR